MREFGKPELTQYEALERLTPLIAGLKMPPKPIRRPIRIGLSPELHAELMAKKRATGFPIIEILLEAIRQWNESSTKSSAPQDENQAPPARDQQPL